MNLSNKETTKISKQLSYILRHNPDSANIKLSVGGWANTDELLKSINVSIDKLNYIVENNDKKRFEFNEDKTKIRASQGHSLNVDLEYISKIPPDILYHGTADKFLDSIMQNGIQKMNRHQVHLSADIETAKKVGSRHGKPIVLEINAKVMHENNVPFFLSTNGVWLVDFVPPNMILKK